MNEEKSVVCEVDKTVLLGYSILKSGNLIIAKDNEERFHQAMGSLWFREQNLLSNYEKLKNY